MDKLSDKIRSEYTKVKNKGINEFEYENLIKYGLKYDDNFVEKLSNNERKTWLSLQDEDFENKPINLPVVNIPIEKIVFSQSDVSINKIEKGQHKKGFPIFIKKDNNIYIISGNHRLFSQLIKQKKDSIQGYIYDFDMQIKKGVAFDPNNPDIRFKDGGELDGGRTNLNSFQELANRYNEK